MALPERVKKQQEAAEGKAREGKLRWLLGWVVIPGSILLALFLAGVHVGARDPEMWLSRLMLWLF
ncbi:hypothetical protein G6O69_11370 [Pseudenhygromyxa sp. WMMC2535]|uniref:hypothetical protein n=1 Tax=Pseudenhygromyxa sp. WMMC2535 TaxID=2712867 RepID=UPI00155718A8|nr:hypothetical protein [Pseudenhygromyxa sp. WMMC2535]NVB38432.1 hypothetical protein [Pseudenhygromyxa sp. WMMC2535]